MAKVLAYGLSCTHSCEGWQEHWHEGGGGGDECTLDLNLNIQQAITCLLSLRPEPESIKQEAQQATWFMTLTITEKSQIWCSKGQTPICYILGYLGSYIHFVDDVKMMKHQYRLFIFSFEMFQYEIWSWVHSLPERSQVFCIAHRRVQTSHPSHIHIEALTWTCPHLDEGEHRAERERERVRKEANESQWKLRNRVTLTDLCQMFTKSAPLLQNFCIAATEAKWLHLFRAAQGSDYDS